MPISTYKPAVVWQSNFVPRMYKPRYKARRSMARVRKNFRLLRELADRLELSAKAVGRKQTAIVEDALEFFWGSFDRDLLKRRNNLLGNLTKEEPHKEQSPSSTTKKTKKPP
jgi:hypothetical protein